MKTYGFWISLTDGINRRWTYLIAPDFEFARMKARYFFEGSKWCAL